VTRLLLPDVHIDIQKAAPGWNLLPGAVARARKAARFALSMGGVTLMPGAELAISLADDARVRDANRQWRAKDKPTNVLSFPGAPPARLSQSPYLGDIIIARETVVAEAAEAGKSFEDHFTHLVVHGVLHLLGHDHMTAKDAERMETLETAILAALGVPDPYEGSDPLETMTG
jgi:probable rRNA maturation factor